MIFGNPQKFAIECVLDKRETDSPQYSFGHIAIWAKEFMLGDFLLPVLLNTPALFFKESLNYCGQRRDETFTGMEAAQVWEFLDTVLYSDSYESSLNPDELEETYRKFCICPGFSEAFDGEIAFLLEEDDEERFIWQDATSQAIQEVRLRPATYKSVVESFLSWYSKNTKNKSVEQNT